MRLSAEQLLLIKALRAGALEKWDYAYVPLRPDGHHKPYRVHTWWAPNGGQVRVTVQVGTGRTAVYVTAATKESAKLEPHAGLITVEMVLRVAAVMGLVTPVTAGLRFENAAGGAGDRRAVR